MDFKLFACWNLYKWHLWAWAGASPSESTDTFSHQLHHLALSKDQNLLHCDEVRSAPITISSYAACMSILYSVHTVWTININRQWWCDYYCAWTFEPIALRLLLWLLLQQHSFKLPSNRDHKKGNNNNNNNRSSLLNKTRSMNWFCLCPNYNQSNRTQGQYVNTRKWVDWEQPCIN